MKFIEASLVAVAALGGLELGSSYPIISTNVPNSRIVKVDGTTVVGLGHGSITAPSTERAAANPFGKRAITFYDAGTLNEMWETICQEDPDGDGITNGVELCDPDCLWRPGQANPACVGGAVLSHPGFPPGDEGGAGLPAYVKAHASLMIISWLFLAPIGILTALFKKKNKARSVTWFKIHKAAMLSTMILTLLSCIVMVGGKKELALTTTHPKLGFTVVCLAIIQPISGRLRPHNPPPNVAKTQKRLLWEAQHQWTGRTAVVVAFASIITGLEAGIGRTAEVLAGGNFLAALLAVVGVVCFGYVLLVRDRNLPQKVLAQPAEPVVITVDEDTDELEAKKKFSEPMVEAKPRQSFTPVEATPAPPVGRTSRISSPKDVRTSAPKDVRISAKNVEERVSVPKDVKPAAPKMEERVSVPKVEERVSAPKDVRVSAPAPKDVRGSAPAPKDVRVSAPAPKDVRVSAPKAAAVERISAKSVAKPAPAPVEEEDSEEEEPKVEEEEAEEAPKKRDFKDFDV